MNIRRRIDRLAGRLDARGAAVEPAPVRLYRERPDGSWLDEGTGAVYPTLAAAPGAPGGLLVMVRTVERTD